MVRAWKHIIRPLAEAARAKTVLEIGSEIGLSTQVLLNYVREVDGHLHAVDPHPGFDVREFEKKHEGYLTFYPELSLQALKRVPDVDLALVDGDHNWYTVYHELKLLEERHGNDPDRMPLILAHDVGWPYGRRDLYYDPETIPEEYRQPYAREGIAFGKSRLVRNRGMNLQLCNALEEGGPRNGVMTAVDDYLAQSSIDWQMLHIPLYFGLCILAPRQRLASNQAFAEQIQHLEHQLQGRELIEMGEELRLAEGIAFQKVHRELSEARKRISELEGQLGEHSGDEVPA
jgi:hypothetical protein